MASAGDISGSRARDQEALGASEVFLAFGQAVSRAAKVDRSVLIFGERGTGKELAARRLHYLSHRWQGPLVTLNCAALSPTLIEDELFGHEAGAFTGATGQRPGRFESADTGTLFLDEIAGIPMTAQEKILRVVEYGSLERVGSSRPIEVDVRIVGATNVDLKALANAGEFKPDLLDRLSFEVLVVPPLRERGDDVLLLANHFAARMVYELGREEMPVISDEACQTLLAHDWPGNVRELKNLVERAVYRSQGPVIKEVELDPFAGARGLGLRQRGLETPVDPFSTKDRPALPIKGLKQAVRDLEVSMLGRALKQSRYNQKQAAGLLGLSYDQLRGLLRKHGGIDRFS